jgi:hypothetical protein
MPVAPTVRRSSPTVGVFFFFFFLLKCAAIDRCGRHPVASSRGCNVVSDCALCNRPRPPPQSTTEQYDVSVNIDLALRPSAYKPAPLNVYRCPIHTLTTLQATTVCGGCKKGAFIFFPAAVFFFFICM